MESNEQDQNRVSYKDVNLCNLDNAGSIIQTVIINGKKMNIKDFKDSKGIKLGLTNIPQKRRLKEIDPTNLIDDEL